MYVDAHKSHAHEVPVHKHAHVTAGKGIQFIVSASSGRYVRPIILLESKTSQYIIPKQTTKPLWIWFTPYLTSGHYDSTHSLSHGPTHDALVT